MKPPPPLLELPMVLWEVSDSSVGAALNAPEDARNIPGAARLLQRMLDAGLSRYEPDPIAALEQATK